MKKITTLFLARISGIIVLGVALNLPVSRTSFAQGGGPDKLLSKWQHAYFDEINGNFDSVIDDYRDVMRMACDSLPNNLREWYLGTCYFGMLRSYSFMGDSQGTRASLDSAVRHHFWNFSAIESIPTLGILLGDKFVDSVCRYWDSVRTAESRSWTPQPVITLMPSHLIPQKKYPVIIALHGGNGSYELFARRLRRVPDALDAIVEVIPGVLRINEFTNSWDTASGVSASRISQVIANLQSDEHADSGDITLLGFSQGSQLSYEYCAEHPDEIRAVIAFAGFAPKMISEPAFDGAMKRVSQQKIKFIAVSGSHDSPDFLQSTRDLQQRAQKNGVHFDIKIEPEMPHGLPRHISQYIKHLWAELRDKSIGTR